MRDGILIVNKPKGLTSNDVVMKLKRKFKMREIGHTGTLDPDVEGVLVVCLGKMTKLVPFLMSDKKVYTGTLTLGYTTDTEDASGIVLEEQHIEDDAFTEDAVDRAFKALRGVILQRPPMYSAIKVKGRPLYDYARKGEVVEVPEREVTIFDFRRTGEPEYQDGVVHIPFHAEVSHGTYIRTLCLQYGQQLGVLSHMKDLKRVQNGSMKVALATDLQVILDAADPTVFMKKGLDVLNEEKWTRVDISSFNETVLFKIQNGAKLHVETPHMQPFTVITKGDKIVSFYERREDAYRCVRGIFEGAENGVYST